MANQFARTIRWLAVILVAATILSPAQALTSTPPNGRCTRRLQLSRRRLLAAGAPAALLSSSSPRVASGTSPSVYSGRADDVRWGPLKDLTNAAIEELDALSRDASAGRVLPSGVRVIDLVEGSGREPRRGERVYTTYKVWAGGFRSGPVVEWSYIDGRPYAWTLGQPTDRIPTGADEGVMGMREGGWRRLVVPNAYGSAGLRRITPVRGGGRVTPPKAGFTIAPGADAFFDLILVDGGSGRCDELLNPAGMSEEQAAKLRSLTCLPGSASLQFNIATGVGPPIGAP